jgi:hypothetical protein
VVLLTPGMMPMQPETYSVESTLMAWEYGPSAAGALSAGAAITSLPKYAPIRSKLEGTEVSMTSDP